MLTQSNGLMFNNIPILYEPAVSISTNIPKQWAHKTTKLIGNHPYSDLSVFHKSNTHTSLCRMTVALPSTNNKRINTSTLLRLDLRYT